MWSRQWPWQCCLTLVPGIPEAPPPGQGGEGLKYACLVVPPLPKEGVVTEIQELQKPSLVTLRTGEVAQLVEGLSTMHGHGLNP